jgi:hypothetical protein
MGDERCTSIGAWIVLVKKFGKGSTCWNGEVVWGWPDHYC